MDKRLKAEIWEIQIILYLILAQLIHTHWIKYIIWFWCIVTFIGCQVLLYQAKKEDTQQNKK